MPPLVADTHALVWHLTAPRRVGRAARRALEAADEGRETCYVPAIVLIEVALLHERGRLRVGVAQVLDLLGGHPGYAILPMDIEQAVEFSALPGVRDPMDRMLLAAARATGARLLSADDALARHGTAVLWDE